MEIISNETVGLTYFQVLRVLVGNKIDRDDHEIPADVGEEFANRHGMYFLQVINLSHFTSMEG